MSRLIWLIDDTDHWHAVTAATVATAPDWEFAGFHTAEAGILAFRHAVGTATAPAIILCDFYLNGAWRGDVMCRELRALEVAAGAPPICMVGHSTSPVGSQAIVQAGADRAVAKYGDEINGALLEFLQNFPY
jgi:CheY-like chemotaxis protein